MVWEMVIDCHLLHQWAYILTIIAILMVILGSNPFLTIHFQIVQPNSHLCYNNYLLWIFIQFYPFPSSIFFLYHSSFFHERIYRCHQCFYTLIIFHLSKIDMIFFTVCPFMPLAIALLSKYFSFMTLPSGPIFDEET